MFFARFFLSKISFYNTDILLLRVEIYSFLTSTFFLIISITISKRGVYECMTPFFGDSGYNLTQDLRKICFYKIGFCHKIRQNHFSIKHNNPAFHSGLLIFDTYGVVVI